MSNNTKDLIRVKIRPSHKKSIDELLENWDFKTNEKVLGLLEGYCSRQQSLEERHKEEGGTGNPQFWITRKAKKLTNFVLSENEEEYEIEHVKDIRKLEDSCLRFELTDEIDSGKSFDKIFENELGKEGIYYTIKKLRDNVKNVCVPEEFGGLLWQSYRKFISKAMKVSEEDKISLPKAPLFLVIGPSGGGKTATVKQAIDDYLFQKGIIVEEDYSEKIEKLRGEKPLLWEADNPEIIEKIEKQSLRDKFFKYKDNSKILKKLFKKNPELLKDQEEFQQITLEKIMVEPSDVQSAKYGETGDLLKKKIGDVTKPKVVHFEEFQNIAFSAKTDGVNDAAIMSQQGTLNTTLNVMLDNVINGSSPMMVIATTNSPGKIQEDIYRRFNESGFVIDISKYWAEDKNNLQTIVGMEVKRHDLKVEDETLKKITKSIYNIFEERTLDLTPAYVRKLLSTVIEERETFDGEKEPFNEKLFEDKIVLRKAFENVARNLHEDLFNKIVKSPPRNLKWEDYKGGVKDDFSSQIRAGLHYNDEHKKGIILFGPPGGGKTFLTRVYAASNPDLTYLSVKQKDLQNLKNPVDGMVENIHTMYNIARMMAPTFISIQEADAMVETRSADGSKPFDKVTNTFLDIFDGDTPLRGVYTVMTTNLPEKIDRAFIRSERADLLNVTGRLSEKNKKAIISGKLEGMVLEEEVNLSTIYQKIEGICYVPADYAKFVDDIKGLQSSQYKIIKGFGKLFKHNASKNEIIKFIEQNTKALEGILKYYDENSGIIEDAKQNPSTLSSNLNIFKDIVSRVNSIQDFPIKTIHLDRVYKDFTNDPMRVGLEKKKKVMSQEISKEPQPGFVIGVGANSLTGVLTPIKTSLPDRDGSKVKLTGAVGGGGDAGVGQMEHSASEAKTLVGNYLSQLFLEKDNLKDFNPVWAINELLNHYSLHHQFLTADYSGGGASAGFALTTNTLSAILNLDVMNDFGITGAPWTGGQTKKDVGSSVIIGGTPQKADAVLNDKLLRRMFVPHKNYEDIPFEQHESYWSEGKLVRPVHNFRQLVPEIYCFTPEYKEKIDQLIQLQVEYNIGEANKHKDLKKVKKKLDNLMTGMRFIAEEEIIRRATCLYNFSTESSDKKYGLSFSSIYEKEGCFDVVPSNPFEDISLNNPFE